MAWAKKPIDKMDMLHLLGIIYGQTAAGFGKVGLRSIIRGKASPVIAGKYNAVIMALTGSGLLLYEGFTTKRRYKWNLKGFGVPSIPLAEMMITETERYARKRARANNASYRAKLRAKSLITNESITRTTD